MVRFKACERCGGDLRDSSDMYGPYLVCVQCGHMIDLPSNRYAAATSGAPASREMDAAA